jgi:hypothetical protein
MMEPLCRDYEKVEEKRNRKSFVFKTGKARGKSTVYTYAIRISDFLVQCMNTNWARKKNGEKKNRGKKLIWAIWANQIC